MYEYVLPRFTLYESKAFGGVKPLHCTLFSHSRNLLKNSSRTKPLCLSKSKQGCRSYQLRSPEKDCEEDTHQERSAMQYSIAWTHEANCLSLPPRERHLAQRLLPPNRRFYL